jgi:hypothetical protein
MRKILESCPSCGGPLVITTVRCERCSTEVKSEYAPCTFCALTAEQSNFVALFLRNRGNQTDMEKSLGVSYQTIRGKLDEILRLIGQSPAQPVDPAARVDPAPESPATGSTEVDRRRVILASLAAGSIDVAGAMAALRSAGTTGIQSAPATDNANEKSGPESAREK